MDLKILTPKLLLRYKSALKESPIERLDKVGKFDIPVNYFQFYKSVSSVYSSRIEGEDIEFDSFFKHKFMGVQFRPDYTRRADDLYAAYDFIDDNTITLQNIQKVHAIITSNILPVSQQGILRTNPMFVINSSDKIEYVAAEPNVVKTEIDKLFADIDLLLATDLDAFEVFYYAALIHLVFVKIHPFQDGNGRTARLLENWFLIRKIGHKAVAVKLEKNYYNNINHYYSNLRKIGLEYHELDYGKSLDFLLMTAKGIEMDD